MVREELLLMFANCFSNKETHSYLVSPDFEFFFHWKDLLHESSSDYRHYELLDNFIRVASDKHIAEFCQTGTVQAVLSILMSRKAASDPTNTFLRCSTFRFLVNISTTVAGAQVIEQFNRPEFFCELVSRHRQRMFGVQAMIIISNVYCGDDEDSEETSLYCCGCISEYS
jgi:hypothetical protein